MELHHLRTYLESLITKQHVPGLDCIVYKNHDIIFRYCAGVSDIDTQETLKEDALYQIFSMTKLITCVCALQLFEQGKYGLDDEVSNYLPEFQHMVLKDGSPAKAPITVRHLFSMSAGLSYRVRASAIVSALNEGKKSTRDMVSAIAKTKLGFEPGTHYQYSFCHDVLGALIEVWSGQSFGEYVNEHICKPLEMHTTYFGTPTSEEHKARLVTRYIYDENRLPQRLETQNIPYIFTPEYESGGAGLTSCIEDYAKFLDALACDGIGKNGVRIISKESIDLMKTNQLSEIQLLDFAKRKGYGYGLGVRTHMDKEKSGSLSPLGEFGWDGAAGSFAMVDTENQLSLTYFQFIHNWELEMQHQMRNALYQDLQALTDIS